MDCTQNEPIQCHFMALFLSTTCPRMVPMGSFLLLFFKFFIRPPPLEHTSKSTFLLATMSRRIFFQCGCCYLLFLLSEIEMQKCGFWLSWLDPQENVNGKMPRLPQSNRGHFKKEKWNRLDLELNTIVWFIWIRNRLSERNECACVCVTRTLFLCSRKKFLESCIRMCVCVLPMKNVSHLVTLLWSCPFQFQWFIYIRFFSLSNRFSTSPLQSLLGSFLPFFASRSISIRTRSLFLFSLNAWNGVINKFVK